MPSIFISHSHDYSNQHERLIEELDEVDGFTFRDLSVSIEKALPRMTEGQLGARLNGRIKFCDVVLLIGGRFAVNRPWMKYEWKMAQRWDKPRIVVRQRYQPDIPAYFYRTADAVVAWDGCEIADAIDDLLLISQRPRRRTHQGTRPSTPSNRHW